MEDTPRSSKRRKLDTPKRIVSTPLKKTTSTTPRASGRLTNRSVSYTNGHIEEETKPKRGGRAVNGAARSSTPENVDIYDDIEGALSVEPTLRPSGRNSNYGSRAGTASTTDELQERAPTPTRGRKEARQSAGRSAKKSLPNGSRHEAAKENDLLDITAVEASTPSKRAKTTRTPAASARKTAAPRSATKKRTTSAVGSDRESEEQLQAPTMTPSKARSSRKAAAKVVESEDDDGPLAVTPLKSAKRRNASEKRAVIPGTEDELLVPRPPSSRKKLPSARRRANFTDNIENGGNDHQFLEHLADAEDAMDIDGNSVMGSVLDPTEPSPFNKPASTQKEKVKQPIIYGDIAAGKELDLLKTIVLERISGKRPSPLVGLDDEYKSVHQLIEHTITAGEGNSMLLIGARGSGKSALVKKVLSEVAKDNGGQYHVVRLNGFIHTDDKIALREIWRQLGKEMEIEEDGSGPGKNYADTLTTLLALLSHPSEQTGELTDQVAKAVVFVMDEFDLFAHHPRQTLLYNLFDIAQSRKAPIAVLGLTTRIDVTNSLEKRVKSRFSHRYVHLSLAKTFTAFQEICKACLTVLPEQLSVEERGILQSGTKGTPSKRGKMESAQDVLSQWNANITTLFASPAFLTTHLAPHFYLTKSIPTVLTSFLLPTSTLSATSPFTPSFTLTRPDSKLSLIPSLPTLALALLIAAARLDIIHDSDTCNFNMAYDEYSSLASKARIQSAAGGLSASASVSRVWGKDVARREWEGLVELGFLLPIFGGHVGGFGMCKVDVALEEIGEVLKKEKGDRVLERWCRAI